MDLLQCPNCGVRLTCAVAECRCETCGETWPISNGIPRFFQMPDHYWGEVGRAQALELIDAARRTSWSEAICARFPEKDNMRFNLLDLQRASWAPMLGLNQHSVVADIGSGYGCITHSLSRVAGEVYSVEAVTERVDFTQERLRQEGISNVRLVQASATDLPLLDNSFDVVVVNGVLEWVGEWDLSLPPRAVQLKFLNKVCRLLKHDGLLLVGIENRFGLNLFLGEKDHSGIPYTSLVPRRVATFMLRHNDGKHYRTELNSKREYRTLTYSEAGYRELLAEAGFPEVSCYWPYPGYNQPHSLTPIACSKWVKQHVIDLIEHPSPAPRRSWRRRIKKLVMPYSARFVNDFLLFATKHPGRQTELQRWTNQHLSEAHALDNLGDKNVLTWKLETGAFKDKSVVRLGDSVTGREIAYLKIFTGTNGQGAGFEAEKANRTKVQDRLRASPECRVRIPESYGTLQMGNTAYYLESASNGDKMSTIVRRLGYFQHATQVARDFHLVCDRIVELTPVLQRVPGVLSIRPSWLQIPVELKSRPGRAAVIERNRYFQDSTRDTAVSWIQHGDLSVENTHLNRASGELHVFDWGDLASGLPPLYDFFQFFVSVAYLRPEDEKTRFTSEEDRWLASFRAVFFSQSNFGLLAWELILEACERLGVPPERVPSLLLEFLVIRCAYYQSNAVQHRTHVRALEACVDAFDWLQEKWGSLRGAAIPALH